MFIELKVTKQINTTPSDFEKIKKGIEKMGFAAYLRPDSTFCNTIIIEGADTFAEVMANMERHFV